MVTATERPQFYMFMVSCVILKIVEKSRHGKRYRIHIQKNINKIILFKNINKVSYVEGENSSEECS